MDKVTMWLVSITLGLLHFFICVIVMSKHPIEKYDGYEDLYAQAIRFNEEYTGNDTKESLVETLALADDYTQDGKEFKVSFEKDKKYLILEYNEDKQLIRVLKNDQDYIESFANILLILLSPVITVVVYQCLYITTYKEV